MPKSKSGNSYILSLVDYFTKWPEAIAIFDKKAETIAFYGPLFDMKITIQAKRYPNHFGLRYRFLVSFAVSSDLNLSTRPFVWG
jgi:hypothetical protein